MLDEHVAHAIAQALRRRGIDVETSAEAELLGAPDDAYLAYALRAHRVVVTNDPDFLRLDQRSIVHNGIAYCEQGTRSIGQIVAQLVLIYEVLESVDLVGRVEFL